MRYNYIRHAPNASCSTMALAATVRPRLGLKVLITGLLSYVLQSCAAFVVESFFSAQHKVGPCKNKVRPCAEQTAPCFYAERSCIGVAGLFLKMS